MLHGLDAALLGKRSWFGWQQALQTGREPVWEPPEQGQAQSTQTCRGFPTAERYPGVSPLNGSFQPFLLLPFSPCPAAKSEPRLCSHFLK